MGVPKVVEPDTAKSSPAYYVDGSICYNVNKQGVPGFEAPKLPQLRWCFLYNVSGVAFAYR